MPCLYCHKSCGDRDFCDEVCYDDYEKAHEEIAAQMRRSECDSLLGEYDGFPFNEGFGTKGNS